MRGFVDRLCLAFAVFLLYIVPACVVRAADPQPYTVSISATGTEPLDQALADYSTLVSLRKQVPVGPFALVIRAIGDQEHFRVALNSFGYYKGKTLIRIAGILVDDPGVVDYLEKAPADPPVEVDVAVDTGPLYHLGNVEIEGDIPEAARQKLGLAPGDPALAAEVHAARERLENALRDEGYALARVDEPIAFRRDGEDLLDITLSAESGPRMDLGTITVTGLEHIHESFVRRHLLVHAGERFNPATLEKARQDLMAIGTFSSVQLIPADSPDNEGRLPVEFRIRESKRHKVSISGQFSTDIGGSVATSWENRNLLGQAERLSFTAGVTQIGGNSTRGIGYNVQLSFLKPDFLSHGQSLRTNIGAVDQSLLAYDRQAYTLGALVSRKLADHWSASIGLSAEQERIRQQGITSDFTLLDLPMELKYDDTVSLLDPTRGIRASASVTPTQPLTGPNTTPFVLFQVAGSTYLDLSDSGRSVLALRGIIGVAEGANQSELPPDRRFYAGGSATVRGFKYQSIGPQFADNSPQGGTALSAGTVEFRQRFLDSYGAVAFVDAGQVTTNSTPFSGTWRIGAGIGARYYTSFGPIRLDFAVPVNPLPGSGSFQIYIGLGQAF
ncbi:MAG: autotransporter assembly complex protein TamA [Gammaproteobacteria bacterium]